MVNFIKKRLTRSHKIDSYISNKYTISVTYGIFIFTFLTLFKPFQLDLLGNYFFGYAIVMSLVYIIVPIVILITIEKLNYKSWSVINLFLLYLLFTIFLALFSWYISGLYKDIYNYQRKLPFLLFYKYTLFVSFVSTPLFLIFNDKLNQLKTKKIENKIKIHSDNKKDVLYISINKLIYISVSGNYTCFYVKLDNEIKEYILRNTLVNVYEQLKKNPTIFRCHKSYIINTDFITDISGNTRGYFINMKEIDIKIPVSRKYTKEDLIHLYK